MVKRIILSCYGDKMTNRELKQFENRTIVSILRHTDEAIQITFHDGLVLRIDCNVGAGLYMYTYRRPHEQ